MFPSDSTKSEVKLFRTHTRLLIAVADEVASRAAKAAL